MAVIKFFASLREQLKRSEVAVSISEYTGAASASVNELVSAMAAADKQWEVLQAEHLLVAVNQTMSSRDTAVKDGDEIAFFPAVTGG
ncbi:MoaD/ThiS family protein [Glaciecola sp. MH2013]|uniref:MoaD/ThiS family protein n=1 Tax=Glaciecola sp. MH2013 TaxID=2785524 RepID=UPI00189E2307|nr:MoaD/ThiS family protein [Glaciecola sp. MH2013]MBF7074520.1 MoaD/ThiS family protein [Glaciecola sp. MH2013]